MTILATILFFVLSSAYAQVNVTQQHNSLARDGVYTDAAFTPTNAANLVRDLNFDGTIVGNMYAQPLYIEGGPNGPVIIAATESNNVYALNVTTGAIVWQRNLGPPVTSGLPCGNIHPLGISGTPAVDLASRALFIDAMIDGTIKKHFVYSLNVDTGAINSGWPVDLNAKAIFNTTLFQSLVQNERGALAVVGGRVYVAFSGHSGDCGTYRGWVVGISISNPANVQAWATGAIGGGIWGHGGVASDGTNLFVVTGNTYNTGGVWLGGEAIVRFGAGPVFNDYWAPTNWLNLDSTDTDLGGLSATLVDVPGATPSTLVLALGKDGRVYALNRNSLGGIGAPIAAATLPSAVRGQSVAAYHTPSGTYFAFHSEVSTVAAYKINATNPPTITSAWSVRHAGQGSVFVTTTDGTNNPIVWVGGDNLLHAFNGTTGAVIYHGGGTNEHMNGTRKWNTGIVARGRIFYPADNKIYAFKIATATPTPSQTPTPTATATSTPSVTPTPTGTPTPTPTATFTPIPTPTPSSSVTPTPTPTATATATATVTSTATPTPSPTPTPSATPCAASTVTTSAASNVASSSTTLNGTVDPNGCSTTVRFQYGRTTSYGSTTANQTKTGNTMQNVAVNISGLSGGTTYHFRIVATNSSGTRFGNDRTFTTKGPPVVTTNAATNVELRSATLKGAVDPQGLNTTVRFQYGRTTSYGSTTGNQTKTGNTMQNVAVNISGLSGGTTYHFRIVATNSGGTRFGSDRTFTTTRQSVVTTNATNVELRSATLNGAVDPQGLNTTVRFQYGRTTNYGSTTPNQTKTGNTTQNVAANISGLTGGITYHFRIVATNSSGTRFGSDTTFTTKGPPVVTTNPATNVELRSATLNGAVDPQGLNTTVRFQYGRTTSYGSTTPNQTKTGNTTQNVAANISGLTGGITYHFRIMATNSSGTRYGSDRTFTTH